MIRVTLIRTENLIYPKDASHQPDSDPYYYINKVKKYAKIFNTDLLSFIILSCYFIKIG